MSACEVVKRDRSDNRGTVNTERFEQYVEECIVPILGRFDYSEPNSIVVMDNVIIHLSERVERLIRDAGAILLLTAPYSPHLNPIEYFFSTYKSALKRFSYEAEGDWFDCHWRALQSVTPEAARATFRHCRFPKIQEYMRRFDDQDNDVEDLVIAMTIFGLFFYSAFPNF